MGSQLILKVEVIVGIAVVAVAVYLMYALRVFSKEE